MFARIARVVPAMARRLPSAESINWSFSILDSTPCGRAMVKVPRGPFTDNWSAVELNSTPFGSAMGFLATRDIVQLLSGDQAQDFATDARGTGLVVGHDALGSRNDRNAQTAQNLGQRVLAAVRPQAGA